MWLDERPVQACLLSASSLAPNLRAPRAGRVPLVVDLIDVDSQKWLDYAAAFHGWKRWVYRNEGNRLRRLEIALARRCRALTLVSEAECRLFRTFCQEGDVRAVPNGVDLEYFAPRPAASPTISCVFVGAMDYPPNVDAVVWFAEQVWPPLRQAQPQATFAIVGRRPTDAVLKLANQPGIDVLGGVPDVRTYLAQASVAVAPLRIARGIQNKVLEALAMGLPVVASSAAMEGLDAADGRELVRADTPQEWIDALLGLWNSPDRRRALAEAGRRYVEAHHAWSACLQEFSRLLNLQ
jgi:sugar transferase (PEP-CTERM/EpsH1 system associated)